MTKKQFLSLFENVPDHADIEISVDVSTCDADAGLRAFGTPVHLQGAEDTVTLICEGFLNQ